MSRPAPCFDPVVHAPVRLQVCALLAPVREAEFGLVRDELEVSDSVLSKHLAVLEAQGYLRLRKAKGRVRQQTWVALTAAGRDAFAAHVAELRRIVGDGGQAGP